MAISVHNSKAVKQLIDCGVIPQECKSFTLHLEVNKAVTAEFEVYLSEAQLQSIADALRDNPSEVEGMVKRALIRGRELPEVPPLIVEFE